MARRQQGEDEDLFFASSGDVQVVRGNKEPRRDSCFLELPLPRRDPIPGQWMRERMDGVARLWFALQVPM